MGRHGKILNPRGRSLLFVCSFSPAARRDGIALLAACKPQCVGNRGVQNLPSRSERAGQHSRECVPVCCGLRRLFWRPCGPWGALRRACRRKAVCAGAAAAGGCGLPRRPSCRTGAVPLGRHGKILNRAFPHRCCRLLRGVCGVAAIAAADLLAAAAVLRHRNAGEFAVFIIFLPALAESGPAPQTRFDAAGFSNF